MYIINQQANVEIPYIGDTFVVSKNGKFVGYETTLEAAETLVEILYTLDTAKQSIL